MIRVAGVDISANTAHVVVIDEDARLVRVGLWARGLFALPYASHQGRLALSRHSLHAPRPAWRKEVR
jgi:hypothetical protein